MLMCGGVDEMPDSRSNFQLDVWAALDVFGALRSGKASVIVASNW